MTCVHCGELRRAEYAILANDGINIAQDMLCNDCYLKYYSHLSIIMDIHDESKPQGVIITKWNSIKQ
jgi:hypothetical protein